LYSTFELFNEFGFEANSVKRQSDSQKICQSRLYYEQLKRAVQFLHLYPFTEPPVLLLYLAIRESIQLDASFMTSLQKKCINPVHSQFIMSFFPHNLKPI
jgi:hypothetical protein